MRTRQHTRSWLSTSRTTGWIKSSGKLSWNAVNPMLQSVVTSTITDVSDNTRRYKPCVHERDDFDGGYYYMPRTCGSSYCAEQEFKEIRIPGKPTIPTLDYTSAVNELCRDAAGAMPLGVNAVVNAIEFASLKTLVPSLLKGLKSVVKHKLGRRSVKDLAGSHLAYSFGLAPTIADLRAFFSIRSEVEKRVRQLMARNGRTIRLTKRVAPVKSTETVAGIWSSQSEYYITRKGLWDITTSGAVSADVTSFFVNDPSAMCKLWSSALGLSTPLQSIWEIVPFSFVIDWFIPIGETFQRVEDRLGMHETVRSLQLSNWGYSQKTEASITHKLVCTKSSYYPGWVGTTGSGGTHRYSLYTRSPGIPATSLLTAPSEWSINRTALSISLLLQKVL